jgi:hypothetical protein
MTTSGIKALLKSLPPNTSPLTILTDPPYAGTHNPRFQPPDKVITFEPTTTVILPMFIGAMDGGKTITFNTLKARTAISTKGCLAMGCCYASTSIGGYPWSTISNFTSSPILGFRAFLPGRAPR